MTSGKNKLAILYSHPGSYTRACVNALVEGHGWEVMALHYRRSSEAPFANEPLQGIARCHARDDFANGAEIASKIRSFGAEVVLISGWMDKGYLQAAKELRKEGVLVIAGSDAQYNGSLRQQVAARAARWYLHPAIDILWVSGERQRQFGWRLGYRGNRCWTGMYCCDHARFAEAAETAGERTPAFLYVGRYVEAKGLDVLLEAYGIYRKSVQNPWKLMCAGAGPLKGLLQGQPGVQDLGFVQPDELPALMAVHSAFILPSRKEPWGVVVQEAAAAGLPLICSDAVGAAVHLLQDHCNGYSFASESVAELARCLEQVSALSQERLAAMAQASREMARQFTPGRWAGTLVVGVTNARACQSRD